MKRCFLVSLRLLEMLDLSQRSTMNCSSPAATSEGIPGGLCGDCRKLQSVHHVLLKPSKRSSLLFEKRDTVSHPVKAWNIGMDNDFTLPRHFDIQ